MYLLIVAGSVYLAVCVGLLLDSFPIAIIFFLGLLFILSSFIIILVKINKNLEKQNEILKGTDTVDETEEAQDQSENEKDSR